MLPMETVEVVPEEVCLANGKIAFSEGVCDVGGWWRIPLKNMSWFINTFCTKKWILRMKIKE